MSRFKIIRPGETLLMTEEWSDDPQWIDGETISESGWAVGPSGPVLSDSAFSGTLASILMSGASFGKQYTLTNIITTSGSKERAKTTQLRCVSGPSAAITFSFVDVDDAELSTVTESNSLTSAFDDGSAISITGGQYAINGGSYTSADGTIDRGATFKVRATSSDDYSTAVDVTLTISGVSDTFTVTTRGDTTPDLFVFTDVTNAGLSTTYTSETVSITGINQQVPITITGGTYSLNGAGYTAAVGSAVAGDSISVRALSSASFSTAVNVVLTVGDVSDTFTVTTLAEDTTPNAFAFTDVLIALLSTIYTSNTITVSGINSLAAISIVGGTYSINGGSYTSSPGTVVNNDTVSVRVTSSAAQSTAVNAALTIGGVSDTYTVTTQDTTPAAFTFTDLASATPWSVNISNTITVSGINAAAAISITGGTYAINGGSYTSSAGTVNNGDTVVVKAVASGTYSTAINAVLTIGGVTDTYTVATYGGRTLFNQSVDAAGALAHWPLNEAVGASTFVDRIGGYNLTGTGATAGVTMGVDTGVTLAGTTSKLARTQHDAGLEREWSVPSTVEAWVIPNVTRSGSTLAYALCSNRDPSGSTLGEDFRLQWNNSLGITQVQWLEKNASTQWRFNCDNVDLPNGTPVHLMVTQSGAPPGSGVSGAKIFINGTQVTATSSGNWGSPGAPTIISATAFQMIGAAGNASIVESAPITIKDVVRYSSIRPQDEALYHTCLQLGRTPPNMNAKPAGTNYVIFSDDVDGDLGNQVDLMYAVALHKAGTITLIAACCSTQSPSGPAFIDSVLRVNGITTVPVGGYKGSLGPSASSDAYIANTVTDFAAYNSGDKANYPDAIAVCRQALVNIPSGGKCRMYEGGLATVFEGLAASSADGISALTGAALITAKVEAGLWESAASIPMGSDWSATEGYNFNSEPVSGAALLAGTHWPSSVPLLMTSGDVGSGLPTGSGGYGDLPNSTETQPQVHNTGTSPNWDAWVRASGTTRPSWGPIAMDLLGRGEIWVQCIGMGTVSITGTGPYVSHFTAATFSNHFWYRRRPTTGLAASISADIHTAIAAIL